MNYYDCAVICKNTELNLTLADQGILMGTGSFANNCHIAGCQILGNGNKCDITVPLLGETPPVTSITILIIVGLLLIIVALLLWQKREEKK